MGRLRNIGRLRAGGGGSAFDLASLFPAPGLWYSADVASGYQDSAGTTALTASGQPVGKRTDKSGNGLHALQATAASRPIYTSASGIQYDLHDGLDDGSSTAAFAAGTLTSDMDFFCAIKRNSAAKFVTAFQTNAGALGFGIAESGAAGLATSSAGTPTYLVNNVAVPGGTATTRAQLDTAMPVGEWLILEVRNLDLSAWTAFATGFYAAYPLNGQFGSNYILRSVMTDAERTQVRQKLAAEVGVTLP